MTPGLKPFTVLFLFVTLDVTSYFLVLLAIKSFVLVTCNGFVWQLFLKLFNVHNLVFGWLEHMSKVVMQTFRL